MGLESRPSERRIAAISAIVERQVGRFRWLETEAANLQALLNEEERLLLEARLLGSTLEELGRACFVTRERIRQKENAILKKLEEIRAYHPIPGYDKPEPRIPYRVGQQ
ncbi:MAG TPA: sigma factor-like helix-turn-helix DNA-binding protein [Ktedonobacteraceae bacterium]|nr:sigma factor-like helix-turn-helix DNA-binding protein [Ktedonobacteraceae bacterium]